MNLENLPFDILYTIFQLLNGKDLLYLSLTNKYFYGLLSDFRFFGSCLKEDYHYGIWPSLHLIDNFLNDNLQVDLERISCLSNSAFEYNLITIQSDIFLHKFTILPPSKDVCMIIKQEVNELEMERIFRLRNLTALTIKLSSPTVIHMVIHQIHTLHLKELDLSECHLSDTALQILSFNLSRTALSILDCSKNIITDVGVAELSKHLPHTNIKELNLSMNYIRKEGLKMIVAALPNSLIKSLDISFNDFENQDLCILYKVLPETNLEILEGQITSEKSISAITRNLKSSKIKSINLEISKEYLEEFLQCIVLSKVKYLEFTGIEVPFKNESATILQNYINKLPVEHLKLNYCKIEEAHICRLLEQIPFNSKLKHLDIWGLDSVDVNIGKNIKNLSLDSLSINYSGMTDDALQDFAINMKLLKQLDLSGNSLTLVGILSFVNSIKHSTLYRLNLGFNIRESSELARARRKIREVLECNRIINVHV
ncbi:hypothetical protein HK103_002061 [Boothiomyces macroporosus]|uniref:F-box domain-containing protein n=1 Tax=Boothiomyces macroporosus TaxID=261099 RepID=A0AAD5U9N7_9FUNG|nr:hypothetical protein HK103_002061 [Boothiomyces macroporosus]